MTVCKSKKEVSVIPVRKYSLATIAFVLKQTYRNFELLIIDDGSPRSKYKKSAKVTDLEIKGIQSKLDRDHLQL